MWAVCGQFALLTSCGGANKNPPIKAGQWIQVVRPVGFEPTTSGFEVRHSIH